MYDVGVWSEGKLMHRTQILLEDDQYHTLRRRAREQGRSMAELIREFVDAGLASAPDDSRNRHRLRELEGIFEAPDTAGRHHHTFLYDGK
jgi:hypothetical protein